MPMMNPYKGRRLLTYRKFIMIRIALWAYLILWVGIWIYALFFWKSLEWYYKGIVLIVLIFFVPSWSDLTQSYDDYRKEWEDVNKAAGV